MKLTNILKSFTKAQQQLNQFIESNGTEIANTKKILDTKQKDQDQAVKVRDNIKTLLGTKQES